MTTEATAGAVREGNEMEALARELLRKSPVVLRAAKLGLKRVESMNWDAAEAYLYAKLEETQFLHNERGREAGLTPFLDEKLIRPGLQTIAETSERELHLRRPRTGAEKQPSPRCSTRRCSTRRDLRRLRRHVADRAPLPITSAPAAAAAVG